MSDYGRPVEFGYFLIPDASDPARTVRTAELLDRLGFDFVAVQDHPYQRRFLDTWTLLSVIAARTARLRVFPDVANLPLRQPAVLAKSAASLDLLSGGRVELGLGAGAFWEPIAAMGGPRRSPGEALRALRDAIEVMRLIWSGQRAARYDGEFYSLAGTHPGPRPAHDIGIWLGAYRPRSLAMVGELADGWVPSMPNLPVDALADAHARIDEAARTAGRDPAGLRRVYNLGDLDEDPVELLTSVTLEHGMDTYVFGGPDDEASLRRIAEEAMPAVRERVEFARR